MTFNQHQTARIAIPGFIALVLLKSLFMCAMPLHLLLSIARQWGSSIVGVTILGVFYAFTGPRSYIDSLAFEPIKANIRRRILQCTPQDGSDGAANQSLTSGQAMDIFYKIVDGDPTLSHRRKRVQLNGIVVTAIGAGLVISLLGLAGHVVLMAGNICPQMHAAWVLLWSLTYALLFIFLWPRAVERHLELSNGQLDIISAYHAEEVRERVAAFAQATPGLG